MPPMTEKKAQLYAKYRLPYSTEAVDALLERTGCIDSVADIGAGTGLLTQHFVGRCRSVCVIEPDNEMRCIAGEQILGMNSVKIVNACAENTTLGSASVDLIVTGNAHPRFNPELAIAEFARILKPGGWLAIFSFNFSSKNLHRRTPSSWDRVSLSRRLSRLKSWSERRASMRHNRPVEYFFGRAAPDTITIPMSVREGWEEFIGAALGTIEAPEPDDPEFIEFVRLHQENFDASAVDGKINVEYYTVVNFAQPEYNILSRMQGLFNQ